VAMPLNQPFGDPDQAPLAITDCNAPFHSREA